MVKVPISFEWQVHCALSRFTMQAIATLNEATRARDSFASARFDSLGSRPKLVGVKFHVTYGLRRFQYMCTTASFATFQLDAFLLSERVCCFRRKIFAVIKLSAPVKVLQSVQRLLSDFNCGN